MGDFGTTFRASTCCECFDEIVDRSIVCTEVLVDLFVQISQINFRFFLGFGSFATSSFARS